MNKSFWIWITVDIKFWQVCNLGLPFYLACLALIQLDQADYTVVWDAPHQWFYSFSCRHLQLLFISYTSGQMFQIKHDPSIYEIQLFRDLTLKTQGQSHGWDERSRSNCGSNIVSIHIPFISCQADNPFLRYNSKIRPWKSKVKVIGRSKSRSYSGSNIASIHITFISCQSGTLFLRYSHLKILPWKSNVKVTTWPVQQASLVNLYTIPVKYVIN